MSNEVYSIGIDLSKLKEALKISSNIQKNIGADSKKKKSMLGDLSSSNKQLKEQNKQLSITEQKLKLIRLTSSKIKLGALALGGLAVGGVIGSLANMKGSLSADLQARNLGLKFGESKALGYADKMVGLNEGTLMNSISGLNKALDDFSQWGNFASLGLNASELKQKNPTEALFDVLDAMKTSDLPKYMKRNIIDQIGIPFDDFQFVLEEGTGELRKFFKQGMGLFGKQGAGVLKSSERALINFQNVLKSLSLSTANKLLPAFTKALNVATPSIKSLGNSLKEFWETIAPELIKFGKWFQKDILPLLVEGIGTYTKIMFKVLKNVVDSFNIVYKIIKPIFKPLGNIIKYLFDKFNSSLKSLDSLNIDKLLVPLSAIGNIGKWWESFKAGASNVWTSIKESFINIWKGTIDIVKGVWTSIKESFLIMITGLIDMLNGILKNKAVSVLTGGATIKAGWGYDEQGNFSKRTYDSKGNYSYTKVNDGVITKDGQVIKTNPQDYIFAMKQPQQLATAGAGNYNITINANVRNDNDIIKIKNELNRLITQLNAKR